MGQQTAPFSARIQRFDVRPRALSGSPDVGSTRRCSSSRLKATGLWTESLIIERIKAIREAIVAKNRLFFHRWRPQNETYLFGFRKHEQGKNAAEIAEFDPLVAEAEKTIQELVKEVK